MTFNRFSAEVQGAIDRLRAGGRLFVVEEKPYPTPHQVVVVFNNEQYSLSYNDFAILVSQHIIHLVGTTTFNRFPAEEYTISPEYQP